MFLLYEKGHLSCAQWKRHPAINVDFTIMLRINVTITGSAIKVTYSQYRYEHLTSYIVFLQVL